MSQDIGNRRLDGPLQLGYQLAQLAVLVSKTVGRATKPNRAVQYVPLLPLLDPKQRGKLVDVVTNPHKYGCAAICSPGKSVNWAAAQARHVGDMAPGLVHLNEAQQTKLVNTAIGFADGRHVAEVIGKFGPELAPLSEALRGNLVDKAINLENEADRAAAIAGLGPGLAHLNPDQQQALLAAALGMAFDPKRAALQGLCKGLKDLGADQRETLYQAAISDPRKEGWRLDPALIENVGSSLDGMSAAQRDTLVEAFSQWTNEPAVPRALSPQALRGLVAGLKQLTPPQRDYLVDTATSPDIHSAKTQGEAIAALGPALADLTPVQHDKLLKTARLSPNGAMAEAVAGLAAGLAALDKPGKDQLVRLALWSSMDDESTAKTIAALGPGMGHLAHEQKEAVVDRAIGLFKSNTVSKEMKRALGAGLGAGLGSLSTELRNQVVDTLTRKLSSGERSLRACTAAAIVGMGAGRPHMDEAQYQALVAAAAPLQNRRGHDHSVLLAFAAEAVKALEAGARHQPAPALPG